VTRAWQQRADELARQAVAGGEPTAWFDRLWAEGASGTIAMPWDRDVAHPLLDEWARSQVLDGTGKRAVVVGCGLGADAEFLVSYDFDTTAFDVSPAAIGQAQARHPDSAVDYRIADLLDLPGDLGRFDLVVEIFTLQALPDPPRTRAAAAVRSLVAPGGTLLVVQLRDDGTGRADQGPPFPLSREFLTGLATDGLQLVTLEELPGPLWRGVFRRPG
jgi:SAM-dependent methyltransferase